MTERYQDYVIKDGQFVGRFEEMYKKFSDPWEQTTREQFDSSKALILNSCQKLRADHGVLKTLEIGCGFGALSQKLGDLGFEAFGTDISETAIQTARKRHRTPEFIVGDFLDFDIYRRLDPDVFIMAEITWYVLPQLREFISYLRKEHSGKFLIHTLVVYAENVQKYGKEYFTNLPEIMAYYGLSYLEYGEIWSSGSTGRTYFCGRI